MNRLRAAGYLVVRMNGVGMTDKRGQFVSAYIVQGINARAGLPDVLAFRPHPSGFLEARLIEVKRRGGELRPAQQRFINYASMLGIGVIIVEGWDGMERVVKRLCE
jgi:hypothetical protein